MKLEIERPTHLVDISRLPLTRSKTPDGGLRIGALVSNTDLAADRGCGATIRSCRGRCWPGASGQLRNKATTAGNLLQRTRCPYFYDTTAAGIFDRRSSSRSASFLTGSGMPAASIFSASSSISLVWSSPSPSSF